MRLNLKLAVITALSTLLFTSSNPAFCVDNETYDANSSGSIVSNEDNSPIDAGISGSDFEELFNNEVADIRYLKEKKGKTAEEINTILKQSHDIPILDGFVESRLNVREKHLYRANRALVILCLSNGVLAVNYSKEMYQDWTLHNGNGDAFRHALWNYGMAIDVGPSFAKKWSDAHEYGDSNNHPLEQKMDLHNNAVGLQLARNNPSTVAHSTFKNKTREKVRNGSCRRIVGTSLVGTNSSGEK